MLKIGKTLRLGQAVKPGTGPQRQSLLKSAKLLRTPGRTIPWKHAMIYAVLVAAAGGAVAAWDHAYEARQSALFKPASPPVLAKNLVEDVVGPGTVRHVSVNDKAGTLEMTVEDVLVKPGQSPAEMRKNLSSEGALAIQVVRSRMPSLKTITLHLVQGSRALATVSVTAGQKTPAAEFAPGLR